MHGSCLAHTWQSLRKVWATAVGVVMALGILETRPRELCELCNGCVLAHTIHSARRIVRSPAPTIGAVCVCRPARPCLQVPVHARARVHACDACRWELATWWILRGLVARMLNTGGP